MRTLTSDEVRSNLDQAIEQLGGATRAGAICHVTSTTVFAWKKRGNLNGAATVSALRFAKAAKRPLTDFIDLNGKLEKP